MAYHLTTRGSGNSSNHFVEECNELEIVEIQHYKMNETLAAVGSILAGILFVLVFILLGWWIVWVCFLSRFKFVRELLGKSSDTDLTDTDGQTPTTQRRTTGRPNARNRIRRD